MCQYIFFQFCIILQHGYLAGTGGHSLDIFFSYSISRKIIKSFLSPGGAFPNGFASQPVISLSVCQSHVSHRGLVSFVTLFIIKMKSMVSTFNLF